MPLLVLWLIVAIVVIVLFDVLFVASRLWATRHVDGTRRVVRARRIRGVPRSHHH